MERSDLEIWRDFKAGDEDSFCYLYDTYFSILYAYGRKFTQDSHLVQDCVQDLFIELIKRREKLSDTDNIRFYLMRSIRRRIARRMNAASMSFEHYLINDPEKNIDIPQPDEPEYKIKQAQLTRLRAVIRDLPERQKEVLFLKYYFGFSNQGISEIMEINYQSVSNLLQKAFQKIHENID